MNGEYLVWMLLAIGFVPWRVARYRVQVKVGRRRRRVRRLEITAIFWHVSVVWPYRGGAEWRLRVPLIERVKAAVWAAVQSLVK